MNDSSEWGLTLRHLFFLRCVALSGQTLALLAAAHTLDFPVPWEGVAPCLLAALLFNVWTGWRMTHGRPITRRPLFLQLGFDVLQLSALLYFAQGAQNPFVSLLLVPVAVSLLSGQRRLAMFTAALASLCYLALLRWQYPAFWAIDHMQQMDLHVYGMWVNFVVTAVVLLAFGLPLLSALRHREQQLAAMRERNLRDEQLLALGIQAANVAHAFGTPLSTLRVITHECLLDETDPERRAQLQLMETKISQCAQLLQEWRQHANAQPARVLGVQDWLHELVSRLSLLRPHVQVQIAATSAAVLVDDALSHALLSLLNNASEASGTEAGWRVDVTVEAQADAWEIVLRDYGSGVDQTLAAPGQQPVRSRKPDGLGLGLYLANASIERAGGRVQLENHPHTGALTRIRLPRAQELSA